MLLDTGWRSPLSRLQSNPETVRKGSITMAL